MKNYTVVYKLYQKPGTAHVVISASGKGDARMQFLLMGIKHDYIIKIIL